MLTETECSPNIPEYLHQKGRQELQEFLDCEKLFRRVPRAYIEEDGTINPASLRLANDSFNREKFCQRPEDLLIDNQGKEYKSDEWFILEISAGNIRRLNSCSTDSSVKPPQKNHFTVIPHHDPLRCNYSHAIIAAHKNGIRVPEISPKKVKSEIRQQFTKYCTIIDPYA
jgi:hypothetical protein